jgi:hypothetical protein
VANRNVNIMPMSNAYSRVKVDFISFYGGDKELERLLFRLIIIGCHVAKRILVVNVLEKSL